MPSLTEIGIILAVAGAGFAVVRDILVFVANRRKDSHALDVAKAQQPEIMKQLEAGNFRTAAEGITFAQQMMRESLAEARSELEVLRPLRGEVDRLQSREEALEAEATGWQQRAADAERRATVAERLAVAADDRAQALTGRVTDLEREVRALHRQLGDAKPPAGPASE